MWIYICNNLHIIFKLKGKSYYIHNIKVFYKTGSGLIGLATHEKGKILVVARRPWPTVIPMRNSRFSPSYNLPSDFGDMQVSLHRKLGKTKR